MNISKNRNIHLYNQHKTLCTRKLIFLTTEPPEKVPWRGKQQPTPVFLPGKSHGQRNLVGYSPWSHKRIRHDLATKPHHQLYHQSSAQSSYQFCERSQRVSFSGPGSHPGQQVVTPHQCLASVKWSPSVLLIPMSLTEHGPLILQDARPASGPTFLAMTPKA